MEWVGVAVFSDRSGQYAPVTRHFERRRDTSKEGERGCRDGISVSRSGR
jgi:hypothetical protein